MQIEQEETTWSSLASVIADLKAQLPRGEAAQTGATIKPGCPQCQGVGYYKEAVPFGHPHFGLLFPCVCKLRAQQARRCAELAHLSNLAVFQNQTFATFDATTPALAEALAIARAYARKPQGWLVLLGSYGVGKTHLAAAIAHTVLEREEEVLFVVVPDLLDHLRSAFAPTSELCYDAQFELVRTVSLLILDDLGTEAATPWAREKLYQLFNHRYQERLSMVVTSNRPLDELEPRLASRLGDWRLSQVIQIEAMDYRRSRVVGVREVGGRNYTSQDKECVQ